MEFLKNSFDALFSRTVSCNDDFDPEIAHDHLYVPTYPVQRKKTTPPFTRNAAKYLPSNGCWTPSSESLGTTSSSRGSSSTSRSL